MLCPHVFHDIAGVGPPILDSQKANWEPSLDDAGLKELSALTTLTRLNLARTNVTDAGMKELVPLKNLTTLVLSQTNVTDAGLKDLGALKNLTTLDLTWANVTDAGLKELASLKNLASLNLSATNVTGTGLSELAGLQNLTTLYLGGPGARLIPIPSGARSPLLNEAGARGIATLEHLNNLDITLNNVTPGILKELSRLKQCTALNLIATELDDADAKELAAFRDLQILYLFFNAGLTDNGVKHLAALQNLTILGLAVTGVSYEGLMELSSLRGLTHLSVAGSQVSDAADLEFQRRNPKCDVMDFPSWQEAIKRSEKLKGQE